MYTPSGFYGVLAKLKWWAVRGSNPQGWYKHPVASKATAFASFANCPTYGMGFCPSRSQQFASRPLMDMSYDSEVGSCFLKYCGTVSKAHDHRLRASRFTLPSSLSLSSTILVEEKGMFNPLAKSVMVNDSPFPALSRRNRLIVTRLSVRLRVPFSSSRWLWRCVEGCTDWGTELVRVDSWFIALTKSSRFWRSASRRVFNSRIRSSSWLMARLHVSKRPLKTGALIFDISQYLSNGLQVPTPIVTQSGGILQVLEAHFFDKQCYGVSHCDN